MPTEQKLVPKTEEDDFDRRRDRTCNLLIRSQAPCHWASRPVVHDIIFDVPRLYLYQLNNHHHLWVFGDPSYIHWLLPQCSLTWTRHEIKIRD
jgi:hypothetical protein